MSAMDDSNPYLAGRREWNERYGSYIAQRDQWRRAAFASLGVAAMAVGGVGYIGAQNKLVPYVVEVNKLGAAIPVNIAERALPADERVVSALLSRFIVQLRTVTADRELQSQFLNDAYTLLQSGDPAFYVVNEYFGDGQGPRSPLLRVRTETVSIEIDSVLRQTRGTWQMEWFERIRDRSGVPQGQERWRALLSVTVQPPTTAAAIRRNPLGLHVKELSWVKLK